MTRLAPLTFLVVALGCGAARAPSQPPPGAADLPARLPAAPVPPNPADPCASVAAFRASAAAQPQAGSETRVRSDLSPVALARAYLDRCGSSEVVALTRALVRFPTVGARESPADGPSFAAMARYLESWSRARGLRFAAVGANDAWEVGFGEGPRELGFVLHGDVVPSADGEPADIGPESPPPAGWTKPPYAAVVEDGKVFGRGSEDDKGPIAAVLVTLAALAGAGVTPAGEMLAIIGLGEEGDWSGMQRYTGTQPLPRRSISVDAGFPVIVGEAGFVAWQLAVPAETPARPSRAVVTDVRGGEFLTQVPGDATMAVAPARGESVAALAKRAEAALAAELRGRGPELTGAVDIDDASGRVVVRTSGKAVHSSVADEGHNALWPLAAIARRLEVERAGAGTMLALIASRFDGDHFGQKLGLAYEHPVMGKLLVAPTVLRTENGRVTLGVNMRRPAGMSSPEFAAKLDAAAARLARDVDPRIVQLPERHVGEPRLMDEGSELVQTLLDIYRDETGDEAARPITIRGGTYARLFPDAVSFGPAMPGAAYRGHAPDEYIEIAELDRLVRVLFEAAVRLGTRAAGE